MTIAYEKDGRFLVKRVENKEVALAIKKTLEKLGYKVEIY